MAALTPLYPGFGAQLAAPAGDLCDTEFRSRVQDAMGRNGLVLIRDLALEDADLLRFAGQFGKLQNISGRPDQPRHIIRVSNLAEDGSIKPANEATRLQHEANLLWHADSSFLSPGATYSFLHARVVTKEGGHTAFCDTRAAWEALSPDRQRRLEPLYADHSMLHSWRLTGVDLDVVSPLPMPVVRRALAPMHPPSGRRALMIPSHVMGIEGMTAAEAQALLAELTADATRTDLVYEHAWRPGDLLIWDNRCMLHRVTPYRGLEEPRDLRSCRIIDATDQSDVVAQAA